MKWIAVYINTFHGVFEPYGLFDSEEEAEDWIDELGIKKGPRGMNRGNRSLWSAMQITETK